MHSKASVSPEIDSLLDIIHMTIASGNLQSM